MAVVTVTPSVAALLCSRMRPGEWLRWDGGVPPDACFLHAQFDLMQGFRLYFEHESFKLVRDGCPAPEVPGPSFTVLCGRAVCESADAGGMPPDELRRVLRVPAGADESHTVEG